MRITVEADFRAARTVAWSTGGDPEGCPSTVEMPARIEFVTADGSFRESFDGLLSQVGATQSRRATNIVAEVPWNELQGDYEPSTPRPSALGVRIAWGDSVSGYLFPIDADDPNTNPLDLKTTGFIATW